MLKKIKIIITQKMADELNEVQDKCFTKEQQKALGCKKYEAQELEAYYG